MPDLIASDARFDPAHDDPRILAVLEARGRLDAAFAAQDVSAVEMLVADDLVVQAPHNAVVLREAVIGFFRAGLMKYEAFTARLEFVGVRDGGVVVMGEESVSPMDTARHAGHTLTRRFTDVWRESAGIWRLAVRQSTIVAIV